MKVLLDTSAVILSLTNDLRLPIKSRNLIADPLIFNVCSVAVFWEMTIKNSLGKLPLPESPEILWHRFEAFSMESVLQLRPNHLRRLATLPHHHRDPFDRLMIAQALEEGWNVISSDDQWDAYGVSRIWK